MKKILYIENEATSKATSFYKAALEASKIMGWEFHLAYNCLDYSKETIDELEKSMGLHFHQIDFVRNPIHPGNICAYRQLKKLVDETFDIIHCNTPIGGVLGRLVAKRSKIHPVVYEAHGFHFYKGGPLKNWLMYYPVEKIFAHLTDSIITINKEDYTFALNHMHPRNKVYYVPGVGIELAEWHGGNHHIREALGFQQNDFLFLVVGRLEKNKNCGMIIDAFSQIKNQSVKLLFCGDGKDRQMLEDMAESKAVKDRVFFLGNRKDMADIYHMVDCFVLASFREGLSRSVMEAMACGLPCIISDIRGNRDLVDEKGGFLFNPYNVVDLRQKMELIYYSNNLRIEMKKHNLYKIKEFCFEKVVDELTKIYMEQFASED